MKRFIEDIIEFFVITLAVLVAMTTALIGYISWVALMALPIVLVWWLITLIV